MGKVNPIFLVGGALCLMFAPSFYPDNVVASNDGPLGQIASEQAKATGKLWQDLNYLGSDGLGPPPLSVSAVMRAPLIVPVCTLIVLFFIIYYEPSRHFHIYRTVTFSVVGILVACTIFIITTGLLESFPYTVREAQLKLCFVLIGAFYGTFGLCHITHTIKND